ncbi:MAG: hypothetical protein GXY48_05320 [Methanomicrobiales archaeon]|nr:hypothetical protein [Methanomicrobiales archaeon]
MSSKWITCLLIAGVVLFFIQGCVYAEKTSQITQSKLAKNQTKTLSVNLTGEAFSPTSGTDKKNSLKPR